MARFTTKKPEPKNLLRPGWAIYDQLWDLANERGRLEDIERSLFAHMKRSLELDYPDQPDEVVFWLGEFRRFRADGGRTANQWEDWMRSNDPSKPGAKKRVARGNQEYELFLQACVRNDEDIFRGLGYIDEARADLIHTQNVLARILRAAHPVVREEFGVFYAADGVTADDWLNKEVFLGGEKQQPVGHGQVRLVRHRRKKQGPPPRGPRGPRGGGLVAEDEEEFDMGNGPCAA